MKEFRQYSPTAAGGRKDQLAPNALQVEIGTSLYKYSDELKKFIFPVRLADFDTLWLGLPPGESKYPDFPKEKSVLITSDPHWLAVAQFRLYKGLEVLFRDNPELAKKTTFLAEGFPSGEAISVQSLQKVDPDPSDALVRKVLESYLIPGYVAYEWKHHQGIPVVGIEDQLLYTISRDYALKNIEDPIKVLFRVSSKELDEVVKKYKPELWQKLQKLSTNSSSKGRTVELVSGISVTFSDELIWNVTGRPIQNFAVFARNYKMAQTLIDATAKYENPMLFIGQTHLYDFDLYNDVWIFEFIKVLVSKYGSRASFTPDAWSAFRNAEHKGVYHYLKNAKIGFTFLDPGKLGDTTNPDDENSYHKLHKAQQDVRKYGDYVSDVIQKSNLKQGITIRPVPEKAAEYVDILKKEKNEELKRGIVYEAAQEDEDKPNWSKTSKQEVWDALAKDSIWHQPSTYQGRDYEELRVANLGSNCPVIDDIVIDAQTVTSMKTVDLTAPSYQNVEALESRVAGYIDKLSGFTQVDWNGHHFERGVDFQDRNLEVGIPAGRATKGQVDTLVKLQGYAQAKDVKLVINEVP